MEKTRRIRRPYLTDFRRSTNDDSDVRKTSVSRLKGQAVAFSSAGEEFALHHRSARPQNRSNRTICEIVSARLTMSAVPLVVQAARKAK